MFALFAGVCNVGAEPKNFFMMFYFLYSCVALAHAQVLRDRLVWLNRLAGWVGLVLLERLNRFTGFNFPRSPRYPRVLRYSKTCNAV